MIREGWNIVRTAAEWYFSNGYMWILLLIVCVVVMLKKSDQKSKYLVWYACVYTILVCNPFSAIILSEMGMDGVYWRSFWMLPIGALIAWMFVEIAMAAKKQIFRVFIIVASVGAIAVCGKQIYNEDNFQKADNWYKIPQEVIEVSECIEPGNTVLAPIDLLVWLRTYDADIYLPIGRQEYYFSTNADRKQVVDSLSWDSSIDVTYIAANAIDYGCRYIVVGKEQQTDGKWKDYGYELSGETETYLIYKR